MFDSISTTKKEKTNKYFCSKNKDNKYTKLEDEDLNEKFSIILNDSEYAELKEFGKYLGVNIDKHPYTIYTVWVAMQSELPPGWEKFKEDDTNCYYFYNKLLKYSMWEHPLDECYRKIIKEKIKQHSKSN